MRHIFVSIFLIGIICHSFAFSPTHVVIPSRILCDRFSLRQAMPTPLSSYKRRLQIHNSFKRCGWPTNLAMTSMIAKDNEEATTFEPVVIKEAGGNCRFRVLPPNLWPHGSDPSAFDGVQDILIKPGFGWGEGTHPTTYMCLQFISEHVTKSESPSVLDYGTGSGVLAIAAKRLGGGRVVGIDKDDEILECAEENSKLNFGEEHGIEFVHGREVVTATRGVYLRDGMSTTFDVVVANMLAGALARLAPAITSAVSESDPSTGGAAGGVQGGILALSGMRREQVADVRAAYEAQGIVFVEERALEGAAPGAQVAEWVLLKGRRSRLSEEQARARAAMLADAAVS